MAEYRKAVTVNRRVVGSSPTLGAKSTSTFFALMVDPPISERLGFVNILPPGTVDSTYMGRRRKIGAARSLLGVVVVKARFC